MPARIAATAMSDLPRAANPSDSGIITTRLGQSLIEAGYIEAEHLEEAVRFQKEKGGKIPHILVHLGHLQPKQLHEFLGKHERMPSVDLNKFKSFADPSALIPKEYATANDIFPIDKLGKLLTVATAVPLDPPDIVELERLTGLRVRAVLCNAEDIRRVIAQQYPRRSQAPANATAPVQQGPSESEIKLGAIVQILQGIGALPTLSQTVQRVKQAVLNPEVGVREVADIIEHDPPITASLLKLANSAAYGFVSEIKDVQRAATLLGLRETEAIVISSAVLNMTERSDHFDHRAYWDDATFGAFAGRTIAAAIGRKQDGASFTAGLLHDIGRFALAEAASKRYSAIDPALRGEDLIRAENELLGIAHPEAGFVLAEQWKLPPDIAEAIRFHHNPEAAAEHSDLCGIVALASAMTEARHHKLNPLETCRPVLRRLKLELAAGLQIYSEAVKTMRSHGAARPED